MIDITTMVILAVIAVVILVAFITKKKDGSNFVVGAILALGGIVVLLLNKAKLPEPVEDYEETVKDSNDTKNVLTEQYNDLKAKDEAKTKDIKQADKEIDDVEQTILNTDPTDRADRFNDKWSTRNSG